MVLQHTLKFEGNSLICYALNLKIIMFNYKPLVLTVVLNEAIGRNWQYLESLTTVVESK